MENLYILLITTFLSFVANNPIEYEYSLSADSYSNSKSDQIENDRSETDSLSEDISQRLYKRQIESGESVQYSLSDIIENIEDSLLDSALGASNIYGILTKRNSDNQSNEKDIEHPVAKRQDDTKSSTTSSSSSEEKSKEKSNEKSDEKSDSQSVITHFTAREVPISDDDTAHVAVDRVRVFVANQGFLPMIPSFDLHYSGVQHESIKEILEDVRNSKSSEEKDNIESTTEINSTVDLITEKITPKKTVEELKEAEEELKEKAAEVEAEPIILSARV